MTLLSICVTTYFLHTSIISWHELKMQHEFVYHDEPCLMWFNRIFWNFCPTLTWIFIANSKNCCQEEVVRQRDKWFPFFLLFCSLCLDTSAVIPIIPPFYIFEVLISSLSCLLYAPVYKRYSISYEPVQHPGGVSDTPFSQSHLKSTREISLAIVLQCP